MLKPHSLKSGDSVYILSTARYISLEAVLPFVKWLEGDGYNVKIGASIGAEYCQYAGSDDLRVQDFQNALDDNDVKAIFFAKGGYGSIRIADKMNWDIFVKNPKWVIGFSDMTVWHNHINQFFAISTIHGLMATTFEKNTEDSKRVLCELIQGEYNDIVFEDNEHNRFKQSFKGQIIGGNLSIMYSLLGTNQGWTTNGKILFLEDLDEYLYHIDRMMKSIELAGKFKGLNGILIGGFTDLNDNDIPFGKNIEEIILEHTEKYKTPIAFGVPSGHIHNNIPLVMGADIEVKREDSQVKISYL